MRSLRLLAVAVLALVLALSSTQNAFATITSVSLEPTCGPPGTAVTLMVRFTEGSHVSAVFLPDVVVAGCDYAETAMGCWFTVPEGVDRITITITEDGVPSRVLTFDVPCPTVGGFIEPVNKLALLSPWLAVLGCRLHRHCCCGRWEAATVDSTRPDHDARMSSSRMVCRFHHTS